MAEGDIPVLLAQGKSLAEAWEDSLLKLYRHGCDVRTEYDRLGPDGAYLDPPSKDATMIVVVQDPASEPLIHRAFPGGPADLEEYRQEVCDGIKDHWIRDPANPDDSRWEYTYHERLFAYSAPGVPRPVNQIDSLVEKLAGAPHTRRAQAITWKPWIDLDCVDPPCLQSMWFRLLEHGAGWRLNMNVRFRSRDAYDAAFMNIYAFISLQQSLADVLSRRLSRPVSLGRYVDMSDSYHIYGSRLAHFENMFLAQLGKRSFEERTWTRADVADVLAEAKPQIAEKVRCVDARSRRPGC
ncbi:MAG: thymidylate synthase [Planctomycetota bacterium]